MARATGIERDIHFATAINAEEAENPWSLTGRGSWTGWQRRLWPADVEWPGQRVYAFDKRKDYRRFCAVMIVTKGGSFEYRTPQEFWRGVRKTVGWSSNTRHRHFQQLPFRKRGKPCVGFAIEFEVEKLVDIPFSIPRFPQIGWLRLTERAARDEVALDVADLYEGGITFRQHKVIERNPKLRSAARNYWQDRLRGRLRCLICRFDFERKYGERGLGFIEMHHENPLHKSPNRKKKHPSELKPVCSNCHRMLHRRRDLHLTVNQLRRMLSAKGR